MNVVPFDDISSDDWDSLVDHSSDGWLFHRASWVRIESSFFPVVNHSFGVLDDRGRLAGLCPLYLRNLSRGAWTERLLDSGHHRQSGPAFLDGLPAPELKAVTRILMQHILALGVKTDADRIQLNANNLAPVRRLGKSAEIPFWVQDYGFQPGLHLGPNGDAALPGMATVCADQVVDLTGSEEAVFDRLDPNFRKAVRKAQKSGLQVDSQARPGLDLLDEYYSLAQVSAQRTGESLAPLAYYRSIGEAFRASGKCVLLLAKHQTKPVGGLLLLIDRRGGRFLGNVSHHDYLPLRVNNFIHWEGMRLMRAQHVEQYELGPIFPELPPQWPISRLSRFKGEFGGQSREILQGSLFRKPERYLEDALRAVRETCQFRTALAIQSRHEEMKRQGEPARDLAMVLRRYGFMGLPPRPRAADVVDQLGIWWPEAGVPLNEVADSLTAIFNPSCQALEALPVRCQRQNGPAWIMGAGSPWFAPKAYRALKPYVTFSGTNVEAIWRDGSGQAVLAWLHHGERRILLVGLDVVEEIVRYTQGDPDQTMKIIDRRRYGFEFERANYLFDPNLVESHKTIPWADRLGYELARLLAVATGLPLLEPLPGGARGAVLLTGDDDQAYLEKYQEQLAAIGNFPITYFLLPQTRHTRATLTALPRNVAIGLHVDALPNPDDYDRICAEQAGVIRALSGQAVQSIRNHGFLSRGYLGHLDAWEKNDLRLDVNYAGLDGTALTGSFLAGPVRRSDGSWSSHFSLLTAFGDGMIYVQRCSEKQAVRRIRAVAATIARSDPGVLVFNMHPQNIADTKVIHRAIVALGKSPGWLSLDVPTYWRWLEGWSKIVIERPKGELVMHNPAEVTNLAFKCHRNGHWENIALPGTVTTSKALAEVA